MWLFQFWKQPFPFRKLLHFLHRFNLIQSQAFILQLLEDGRIFYARTGKRVLHSHCGRGSGDYMPKEEGVTSEGYVQTEYKNGGNQMKELIERRGAIKRRMAELIGAIKDEKRAQAAITLSRALTASFILVSLISLKKNMNL